MLGVLDHFLAHMKEKYNLLLNITKAGLELFPASFCSWIQASAKILKKCHECGLFKTLGKLLALWALTFGPQNQTSAQNCTSAKTLAKPQNAATVKQLTGRHH